MKSFAIVLVLLTFPACTAIRRPPTSGTPAAGRSSETFPQFVDEYFAAQFRFSPSSSTELGLHQYDHELEDVSRASFEARVSELHSFLSRLEALDRETLDFDERIDAAAIEGDIRARLLDYETLKTWQANPMLYAGLPGHAVGALVKRDFAPARDRLVSVIARMRKIPAIYKAGEENVVNPPREFTDLAIRMSKGTGGYFSGTVTRWARAAAGGDQALLGEFEKASSDAVDAAGAFSRWLESDLLPRSNGSYAIGKEHFLAKLRYEEMVELPLDELLARGEAQLQKDYDDFVRTAKLIDPAKSPHEVMASLSDEHPTAEELVPSVRHSLDDARRFVIDHDLVTIPSDVRPIVAETPPYARAGSFASMDTPGPFEQRAKEAYYYVTPVEKDWDARHKEEHLRLYNPYVVALINIHEAYPGHYTQFLYAPRFPTKTRKLIFSGTNAEGWAHYCEQMMIDEGYGGNNPKYRLAQLEEALLRDVRYVVGIRLHTSGWSVEEGAKLFVEKGFQEPANAYEEARRGAYNPTYLYYTLGKLEIQQLRDDYRRERGATLKQFHDAFISEGGLPIPLVRQILMRK